MAKLLDLKVGERITMKKRHPCGQTQWDIVHTGMKIGLKCIGCGRRKDFLRSVLETKITWRLSKIDTPNIPQES